MTSRATYRLSLTGMVLRFGLFTLLFGVATLSLAGTAGASLFSLFVSHEDTVPVDQQLYMVEVAENSQTIPLLQAARNVDPNLSRGVGTIGVVDGVALVAEESPFVGSVGVQEAPASPDQISWYIVQEGDALSQVATLFGVSVNTIVWANELASNKDIHPGQTLLILPITGVQHTVAKGDTAESLAEKFHGDAAEILAYNNIPEGGTLSVGEVVTIPGGEIEEEVKQTSTAKSIAVVSSGPNISGYYIHPIPGAVRTQGIHGYNGVDYGAPVGTPIRAAAGGSVIVSRAGGYNGGYGNYVVIDHPNGTQTLSAHMSKNAVWQGQKVVAGQIIGYVGNTGRSTGPHLHFEVRGAANPF